LVGWVRAGRITRHVGVALPDEHRGRNASDPVVATGVELPYQAIRANIGDSLHLLVHLERRNGRRMVREALRLERFDPQADRYITVPAIALE
jgi:hypothetical protein